MELCTKTRGTEWDLNMKETDNNHSHQVVSRNIRFVVYRDNRPCYKCISHGCIQDGENLCALCKEYMCLSCTVVHYTECEYRDRRVPVSTPRVSKHVAYMERHTESRAAARTERDTHTKAARTTGEKNERDGSPFKDKKGNQRESKHSRNATPKLSSSSSRSSKQQRFSGQNGSIRVGMSTNLKQTPSSVSCNSHVQMHVENYCKMHDALCCEECLHSEHQSCTVQPLDEVAHGIKDNTHMQNVMQQIAKIQNDCRMFVERNERLLDALDNMDDQKMRKTHHSVRMSDVKYVARRFVTSGKYLETNVALRVRDLENALQLGNDIEIFVCLKRNQKFIVNSKDKLRDFETEERHMRAAYDSLLKMLPDLFATVNEERADSTMINDAKDEIAAQTEEKSGVMNLKNGKIDSDSDSDRNSEQNMSTTQQGKTRPLSNVSGRSVIFKADSRSASRASGKDRILKYGLVTEFYLQDMQGTEASDVVRLQSAPPQRIPAADADAVDQHDRPKSMYTVNRERAVGGEQQTNRLPYNSSLKSHKHVENMDTKDALKSKLHMLQASRQFSGKVRHNKPTSNKEFVKQTVNTKNKPVQEIRKHPDCSNNFSGRSYRTYKSQATLEREMNSATPLIMRESSFIKAPTSDRQGSGLQRDREEDRCKYNRQNYARRPRSKLLLTEEQIVRMHDEEMTCDINGITCMPDGRVIVSDFNNKSIKMFQVGRGRASRLPLTDPPRGITAISNSQAAAIVGLAHDRLLIINIGMDLKVHQRYKTGCMCKALTNFNSHIYLLCMHNFQGEIRIVNTDGVVNIRISLGHIVPAPVSIAVNPLNGIVYVTDATRGVHAVETGKTVTRTSDWNVERYHGVAVDINNTVYVCTENASGVQEVSYDWKHLMPVLLGYDGEGPKVICYNAASNSLVMSSNRSETVQIYKILDQLILNDK